MHEHSKIIKIFTGSVTYTGDMASDILLCCVGIGCGVTLLKPALLDVLSPFTGVTAPLRDNTPVGVSRLNTSEK